MASQQESSFCRVFSGHNCVKIHPYQDCIAIWIQLSTKRAFVSSSGLAGVSHPCRRRPEPPVLPFAGAPRPRSLRSSAGPAMARALRLPVATATTTPAGPPSRAAIAAHAAPDARAPLGGRNRPVSGGGRRAPASAGRPLGSALPRSTLGMGVSRPTALMGAERNGDTIPSVQRPEGGDGALRAPPLGSCSLGESQGQAGGRDGDCASRRAARPHCGHARSPLAAGPDWASLPAR